MITMDCYHAGKHLRLDYDVTIDEGFIQYFGTLHSLPPEIFCFIVAEETGAIVVFAPNNAEKSIRETIIDSVTKNEARLKRRSGL
jgi:hypothetical protein